MTNLFGDEEAEAAPASTVPCSHCLGTGRAALHAPERIVRCDACEGAGRVRGPKAIEVYVDTFGRARCTGRNCRREILWATIVKTGRKMCFDDPSVVALRSRHEAATNRLIYELPLDGNHWAVCPDRDRFKR